MTSAQLVGRLEIDAAGVPATLVADERGVVLSSDRPADLVAEALHVRRNAPVPIRLRDLPLTIELHGPRGLVAAARPGRRRIPSVRIRRPLTLLIGWWRALRPA